MRHVLLITDDRGDHFAHDASTPKSADEAWLELFALADELVPISEQIVSEQLREMARRGNPAYARAWLELEREDLPVKFRVLPVFPLRPAPELPVRKVECPEALAESALPHVQPEVELVAKSHPLDKRPDTLKDTL